MIKVTESYRLLLEYQGSLFMERDKPTCSVCKNMLSQDLFCLRVVDSAILPFCVTRLNIILKKYQTDLTVTLTGNDVSLKAAFSKSLHWKMHEYIRELVAIHKNHNHKKHFLELQLLIQ